MRMIQAWYMDVSRAPGGMVSIVAAFPAPSQTGIITYILSEPKKDSPVPTPTPMANPQRDVYASKCASCQYDPQSLMKA